MEFIQMMQEIKRSSIKDVKVTEQASHDGARRVQLDWIDAAGAQQSEIYFGMSAENFAIDLRAATMLGEYARDAYLKGRIRELDRQRRG